jgi:choline-sulfatase
MKYNSPLLFFLFAVLLAGLPANAVPEKPNVVFLSVDTLRADVLGCYGYDLETSPALDTFAEEALLFEDCVCEVPLTAPSFSSMLASRYPRMVGATRNGLRIAGDAPLVQEIFREAGYYTFCVQSNWTLKAKLSGLDRGFEAYDDDFHKKRWGFIKPERLADEVTEIALEMLADAGSTKPFFAWIHYSDPHAPYKKHKKYNPSGKKGIWRMSNEEKVRVKYDMEVAYTDAHIKKILDALPENTAVLFVGDHGESLYEHDYLGHGRRIYQPGLHIPLMIRAAGVTPGRTRMPARGIDIGTTLLGLAGLAPAPEMLGLNLLEEEAPADRARVIETYGGAVPKIPGVKALLSDAGPIRQGVLIEGWKLILNGRDEELFYLPDDPGELENLAPENPEKTAALRRLIEEWDQAAEKGISGGESLDEEDIRALESLGYVD